MYKACFLSLICKPRDGSDFTFGSLLGQVLGQGDMQLVLDKYMQNDRRAPRLESKAQTIGLGEGGCQGLAEPWSQRERRTVNGGQT